MLRLASSKVAPTAFRAIASSSALVSVGKTGRLLSTLATAAHATGQNQLVKALDTEIKFLRLIRSRPSPPASFPFKIEHSDYTNQVVLSREIEGEVIKVTLLENEDGDAATETHGGATTTTTDSDSDTRTDSDSDTRTDSDVYTDPREESDDSGGADESKSVPLKVEIFKPNGKSMKFAANASDGEIMIERLTTEEGNKVICSQLLIKPDGELQTALREFLETRGVGGFVSDYMRWSSKLPASFPRRLSFGENRDLEVEELQKLKNAIEDW